MNKRRVMLFESWSTSSIFDTLLENVSSEIKDVQQEVDAIMKDLKDEGKDAETDEVKAAILMQAIDLADAGKDLDELDIDKAKADVKEGMSIRGQELDPLNESESGLIKGIEVAGALLGNAVFLEFISKKLEKLTGKSMDPEKMKGTLEKIFGGIKKVTGFPGKAISKFFGWAAEKLGANLNGKKAAEMLGMGAMIIFLGALGVTHFPVLGVGVLWWILSLTGLVGKSLELVHIYKEVKELITKVSDNDSKAAEEVGVAGEELNKLVVA